MEIYRIYGNTAWIHPSQGSGQRKVEEMHCPVFFTCHMVDD